MQPTDAPNHRYYRTVQGRWRCAFSLVITDKARFRAFDLGAMNRLRLLSLLLIQRVFGPLRMETTVDCNSASSEVRHTVRLSKWGFTMFASEEILALDANGRDVTMRGRQWMSPWFWIAMPFGPGSARIDDEARHADYAFPWFGTTMRQHATIDDDSHVTIVQETDWSRGVQPLARQSS